MKHTYYHRLLGLIVAAFFIEAPICRAELMFDVILGTSGLVGLNQPAAPFYIDFQLNDGSGNFSGAYWPSPWTSATMSNPLSIA